MPASDTQPKEEPAVVPNAIDAIPKAEAEAGNAAGESPAKEEQASYEEEFEAPGDPVAEGATPTMEKQGIPAEGSSLVTVLTTAPEPSKELTEEEKVAAAEEARAQEAEAATKKLEEEALDVIDHGVRFMLMNMTMLTLKSRVMQIAVESGKPEARSLDHHTLKPNPHLTCDSS